MTREPATLSMPGQFVITFFTFTLFRAIASSGPYPPAGSAPGIAVFQNRWLARSLKRGEKR